MNEFRLPFWLELNDLPIMGEPCPGDGSFDGVSFELNAALLLTLKGVFCGVIVLRRLIGVSVLYPFVGL
jgi:hypothetical protein